MWRTIAATAAVVSSSSGCCCCSCCCCACVCALCSTTVMPRVSIDATGARCAVRAWGVLCGVRVARSHAPDPRALLLLSSLTAEKTNSTQQSSRVSACCSSSRPNKRRCYRCCIYTLPTLRRVWPHDFDGLRGDLALTWPGPCLGEIAWCGAHHLPCELLSFSTLCVHT